MSKTDQHPIVIFLNPGRNIAVWVLILKLSRNHTLKKLRIPRFFLSRLERVQNYHKIKIRWVDYVNPNPLGVVMYSLYLVLGGYVQRLLTSLALLDTFIFLLTKIFYFFFKKIFQAKFTLFISALSNKPASPNYRTG